MSTHYPNSPKLLHLTKDRAPSPAHRSPSRNSLNDNKKEQLMSTASAIKDNVSVIGRKGSFKKKAPPPPVPKKPNVSSKPFVPMKPKPIKLFEDNISKASSAYNETLNKKLSTPLSFSERLEAAAQNNKNESKSSSSAFVMSAKLKSDKDEANIKNELENIFSNKQKRNSISEQLDNIGLHSAIQDSKCNELPRSEITNSLTEVSSIGQSKNTEKRSNDFNDTLDFTLSDNGFDTSCHEFAADEISELQVPDDDLFFKKLSFIPPPPPEINFLSDEGDSDNGNYFENLNTVPPPPPPALDDDSSSEEANGFVSPPSLFENKENKQNTPINKLDDYSFDNTDSSENEFDGLPNLNNTILKQDNLSKSVDTKEDNTAFNVTVKQENVDVKYDDPACNVTLKQQNVISYGNDIGERTALESRNLNNINEASNKSKSSQLIPSQLVNKMIPKICITELKDKLQNGHIEPKQVLNTKEEFSKISTVNNFNSNNNVTDPICISSKPTFGVDLQHSRDINIIKSEPVVSTAFDVVSTAFDVDSGHSTAQSQEISDTEKRNKMKENATDLFIQNKFQSVTNSRESSASTHRKLFRRLSNSSRASRTWSSCSSTDSDDKNKKESKVNLREMLLKHMKLLDSDDTDAEMENPKLEGTKRINVSSLSNEDSPSEIESETHLNDVEVSEWTTEDVAEWLELIGLPLLTPLFKEKNIDGNALIDIDMSLLDDMDIESHEDRELILSEIYALQNPTDGDIELSMLNALDKTSGEEREKMLALLNALQSPSQEAYINSYVMSAPSSNNSNLKSSVEELPLDISKEEINKELNSPPTVSIKDKEKEGMINKLTPGFYDPDDDGCDEEVKENTSPSPSPVDIEKSKKKSKRKGFFASLRQKGNKKSKSALVDPSMNMLIQGSPQGIVRILYLPPNGNDEIEIHLLVTLNTQSQDVCGMCLQYLSLYEDVKCFYIVISRKDRKVQNVDLTPTECPLMFQCKWSDMNTYQFELKHKVDGYIIVNNEDVQQEVISLKLGISSQSTPKDIIPVLLKKFKKRDGVKNYHMQQSEKDDRIPDDGVLLDLPLHGYKFHVFKLINNSASNDRQRLVSFTEVKKMETKIELMEKQIEKQSNQISEYKKSEVQLRRDNQEAQSENRKLHIEVHNKIDEIKKLQNELTNMQSSHRTQQLLTPTPDEGLKQENESLKSDITNQKYQIEHYDQKIKTLHDGKLLLQKEYDSLLQKYNKIEHLNEELEGKCLQMESEVKHKRSDNSDQVKKLYTDNKEYLKQIRILEEKLSDAEYKLSQQQFDQETESAEISELRSQSESLENNISEKDSKILELEYKMQKKERNLREFEDKLESEQRRRKKETEVKEQVERKNEDLLMKMENIKTQFSEKEKQLQSVKFQMSKQEKKLTKQKTLADTERSERQEEVLDLKEQCQEQIILFEGKLDSLQKLLTGKDLHLKQKEFDFSKEKEELLVSVKDYERKLASKYVIIDRLENKIAKSDLNIASKYQGQIEVVKTKEEEINELEIEVARLQSDHASKLRETSNVIRSKESAIRKLDARVKKLEASNRENVKKCEKYISEKDKLLQQVNKDRDKESKELKARLRINEESVSEKEKTIRELTRKNTEVKNNYDIRLKKRDKEYKQQKYLLEKVLEVVNLKAPSLLRHLQETFDEDHVVSPRNK